MLCEKCGNEIKANAKFCPECGAKVVPIKEEAASQTEEIKTEKIQDAEIVEEATAKVEEPAVKKEAVQEEPAPQAEAAKPEEKSATEEIKEKLEDAVEEAKQAGKNFAESETVQNAKKEVNDLLEEAKVASQRQAGQSSPESENVVPGEGVSFLVDCLYWTGRRSRMKYLLISIATSIASLALGSTGIFSLLFCYISAVNLVKRLHDFDKPGWYAFLLMFAEYVIINLTWIFGLLGLGLMAAGSLSGLLMWIIPLLIVWGIKLWVFFVPGTPGPNRFGPEPK